MKKRFTEAQIVGFLREADAGVAVRRACSPFVIVSPLRPKPNEESRMCHPCGGISHWVHAGDLRRAECPEVRLAIGSPRSTLTGFQAVHLRRVPDTCRWAMAAQFARHYSDAWHCALASAVCQLKHVGS